MMSNLPNYQFDLPEGLIAQAPPRHRGESRLLQVQSGSGVVGESAFTAVGRFFRPGDLLVLNQSKVLPARLFTRRQDSGGEVELLLVRPQDQDQNQDRGQWLAMARPGRRLRSGVRLEVQHLAWNQGKNQPVLEIVGKRDDGFVIVAGVDQVDPAEVAQAMGLMPLPPYLQQEKNATTGRQQDARDRDRYQTVFAAPDPTGAASVAAPTAGLHFTDQILEQLADQGVQTACLTLHVGPGTFRPPTDDQIAQRRLHREFFHLPLSVAQAVARTRSNGGRVIAVGTTSLRVLETVARLGLDESGPDQKEFAVSETNPDPVFQGRTHRQDGLWEVRGQTRLFISPPDKIRAADGLLTNFHLPGSSLLMLVAALMGPDVWRGVYEHAVSSQLRFYSYGDCMLILPEFGPKEAD